MSIWGASIRTVSIRLRFTLALAAVGVVLFGTYAVVEYRNERDDLETATLREIRIIGRSLQVSLGNALRDRQRADIEETLEGLEAVDPNVDIHVHDVGGAPLHHSRGAVIDERIERMLRSDLVGRTERAEFQFDNDRLVFVAPLTTDDGNLLGVMAVVRPLDDLDEDLARTRNRLCWVVAMFLVGTIATGMILGTIHVTRPLGRLVARMGQVRRGDFQASRNGPPRRNDEIGKLVGEFNAMIAALAESRARATDQTEARIRLEEGLRRIDKLVTIGQLSAGLAHEIGSPLQVLSGRASTLREHDDPEVRRQAELLVTECDRIARVVDQLLSFGRRKPATITMCNLIEPVRTVIDLLGPEARRRDISLAIAAPARAYPIHADVDQMQQVALNLITNALAATPTGGTVTVAIDRVDKTIQLAVRDTGCGIPSDMQARLFEPFFTTRAAEGGSGLGLAIVRAIATEHHATIEVRSKPSLGSEFVIAFPALEEVARA